MEDLLDKGAVIQRDRETYAIAPHITGGIISPEKLRHIADVAEKYHIDTLKITGAQRIALIGVKKEELDDIWNELGMKPAASLGLCVRSVKICPGSTFCMKGIRDSISVGQKLDDTYYGRNLPNKLKIGVSGCPFSCADSHTRDIGLIGAPKGWIVNVGGKGGVRPRLANRLTINVSDDDVYSLIENIIKIYDEHGKEHERLGDYIERIGLDQFKQLLNIEA